MPAPKSDVAAIRQTIRALKDAGYILTAVNDGEDHITVRTEQEAIDAIDAVDAASLHVTHHGAHPSSHVYFVLGNSPEEVIANHGQSLSHVLDPLTARWAA